MIAVKALRKNLHFTQLRALSADNKSSFKFKGIQPPTDT
jgi:hypothetical protein